jgi:hypothetical protein
VGTEVALDDSAWPLVVFRFGERLDGEGIASFTAAIDLILGRERRFATVMDTRALKRFPDAVERRALATALNKRVFAEKKYNLGNGVVLTSPGARAILTAFNWLRPPKVPQKLFATFDEAWAWSREVLREAGLEVREPSLPRAG